MADQEHDAPQHTAGQLLKAEREKLGLSLQQVAEKMNLTADRLAEIESSEYRQIENLTFAKGYIRSYAREVSLDADMLIALFDQEEWRGRKEADFDVMASSGPMLSKERPLRFKPRFKLKPWMLWTIIVVAVLFVVFTVFHHADKKLVATPTIKKQTTTKTLVVKPKRQVKK